ncbi:tumor necrosis factor receptor superfamily member 10A-like isoform X2 [Diceros bicornis minor]|uniref:tumor necrosis factor receptor superfamily member 10A-like isoform X2 n=1 Tax=Diceros bicornis minor TaxID=77932 RepID=UPI0026EB6E39|nr:tumor necrosis factor receptor superfamily member 10A-like isoform X2 [Diceros bicornis minor]
MPLPGFSQRRRELGALPDLTGQRGPSAPAASGARAGRAPGPRPARGARPRLRGPRTLVFVVCSVLLPVPAASAMVTQQERVPQQLPAPQKSNHSLWEKGCPPGSRVSEDNKNCTFCTYGVDYTSHWSKLSSCLPCSTCKSDEEQIAPCTRTENTRCQCKRGTFHGEDSPEVCQKCSTRCPDGMVEASPCTARSDLKCVHQESGNPWLVMGIVVGAVGVVLLLVVTAYYYRKRVLQGCGVDAKCMNRVFFWRSCPPRGPGALDNRGSPSTLASEQELEGQELKGVSTQSPGEAERLLGPAGAEGSQMRRRLLVPANGADPTESLRLFFNYFPRIVSINSWNMLMRQMGLTDNEIHVSRARALDPGDALYEMLVTWLDKTGRGASVNTLLDALETLGERYAKETIQDHLVGSGKFVYEEGGAGSAVS